MPGRWSILALLFAVRATMAFQYQSVASLAPLVQRDFDVGLADIGLLVGLYLAPGIVIAFPGGAIGRRFGDKPAVVFGLLLMAAGGVLMALLTTWEGQIGGRVLAGTGGVLLNVLMSKMVSDWFAGREIATAMALFVNSWPAGIALGLVTLAPIGAEVGAAAAYLFAAGLVALAMIGLAAGYASPPAAVVATEDEDGGLDRASFRAVILAGAVWALYNVGFAMVFAFGPTLLVERGWTLPNAGAAVSIALWLALISVPLGGFLADRIKFYSAFIITGCLASAALLVLTSRESDVVLIFVALGLVSGLPAGPIMSLPARILTPAARAVGMGVFFTVFYAGMVIGPALGGWAAGLSGTAATALDLGAGSLLLSVFCMWKLARMVPGRSTDHATEALAPVLEGTFAKGQ